MKPTRRVILSSGVVALAISSSACGELIHGGPPWMPYAGSPQPPAGPGGWQFFTPEEAEAVEALVDRLIPPDPDTPGGKDAGCAGFIDRQLAGPYGNSTALYMRPPLRDGGKNQGPQSPPAERSRLALASLDAHCRAAYLDKPFARIPGDEQDKLIQGLKTGLLNLDHTSGRGFFELLIKDTQHGFLADPIYGGNRDMCAWKMIGFPGARHDYRDWIDKHNQRFPLPPLSLHGRPAWTESPA